MQRLFHALLIITFLTQAATGLSRMYIETVWGRQTAGLFGGDEQALIVHKYVGLFMIALFLLHVLYLLITIDWRRFPESVTGPDSMLPRGQDIKDFFNHIRWFLGRTKAPAFDRWAYWEKFDYWAVFWGMVILGGTGLVLAYSMVSVRYMPGWGLNVTIWIHRIEALLAIGHVFIIHFFIGHLRRMNFPMDRAMFEGSADLAHSRQERSSWIRRLEKEGSLDGMIVTEATIGRQVIFYLFGFLAMATGIYLVVSALANVRLITL
ncbi:MAG: cytochrome b/b6 domain-containing protein [Desulfosarcina sp.]|nr:cytochrome b/b6 domain-containing protein [Desulfobacterales bacterium]